MARAIPRANRFAHTALALYLGAFILLCADVIVRLFLMRHRLESMTVAATLIAVELARGLTTTLALLLAVRVARTARNVATHTYALLLLLLGIAYTKIFAFENFAGYAQEWIAVRLFDAGVPIALTRFVFASPEWALWLALAALLHLSVTWPRPLTAAAILASGAHDRTGLLRSVRMAGFDVGDAFRRLAARALDAGLMRPALLWPAAAALGTLHAVIRVPAARAVLSAAACVGLALAITNARAAARAASPRARRRLLWAAQAAIAALGAFLLSALLTVRNDPATNALSLAVLILAPIFVLITLATEVGARRPGDPNPALRRTLVLSFATLAGTAVYHLLRTALDPLATGQVPVREIVAVGGSIMLVAAARPLFLRAAGRLLVGKG